MATANPDRIHVIVDAVTGEQTERPFTDEENAEQDEREQNGPKP